MKKTTTLATDTRCRICGHTLWNVSSRLAEGLGIITLKCEGCERAWGVRVNPKQGKQEKYT